MNEQQQFWKEKYASSYMEKNSSFDQDMGVQGWREMLKKAGSINSFLECGSNIGRNIGFLSSVYPEAKKGLMSPSGGKSLAFRRRL